MILFYITFSNKKKTKMEKSVQELNQDELEELRGNYSRTTTKYGFRCFR
jgi:hypothetical protein